MGRSSRHYERQIDKLLAIIEAQNDRIMFLAGRVWTQPPAEVTEISGLTHPDFDPERFALSPSDLDDGPGF